MHRRRESRRRTARPFEHLLLIGIGGSALGPQFIADALGTSSDPIDSFLFRQHRSGWLRSRLRARSALDSHHTLVVVISKSGGTKETRNGMLEAKARFEQAGLDFGKTCGRGDRRRQRAGSDTRRRTAGWRVFRCSIGSAAALR